MPKKIKLFTLFVFFTAILNSGVVFAQGIVSINGVVMPLDATNFLISEPGDGSGTCVLSWNNSETSNVDTSRILTDSGFSIESDDVPVQIADLGTGTGNPESFVLTDLVIDWTYIISHNSLAGSLQSPGLLGICTPTSALPAPVMTAEPATTIGTSNTVYWTNGGIDDATLECNVQLSTTDLNIDPLTFQQASGWTPCPASGTTYSHTFSGLTLDTTYFYHVQSRTPADGLSPFSNVVFSTQISSGGGTTPPADEPPVAGGSAPVIPTDDDEEEPVHEAPEEQICGNSAVETGEECDDGNNINNDGCNSACMLEPSVACGNGILEDPEQCDDGNNLNGDGCSETCAIEAVKVRFEIKGAPEFRVLKQDNPNLSLNSQFLVYKPAISNLDSVRVKLDDFGNATYEGLIVAGTYDFGLNGEAHNTKLIRGIEITPATELVVLDFTYAETVKLTAGDTVDDNYINGVDMSKLIGQYRMEGAEVLSDLNREGYVNGIDASIIITNYRKEGEKF